MSELPERYTQCTEILEEQATPNDIAYHYTTWQGLKNILETQQLWLTAISHLNDTSEVKYAVKVLQEFILSLSMEQRLKTFWEALFNRLRRITSVFLEFYISAFCTRENYLYAWRSYSSDAAGFAIGFKPSFFTGLDTQSPDNAPGFGRGKVYYDISELGNHIERLVNVVNADLGNKPNGDEDGEIAAQFSATVLPLLTSIKHPAYEGEHEHRIYATSHDGDRRQKFFSPGKDLAAPHLNSKKRMFFNFELCNVTEIWVGPRLNFDHAKMEIENILVDLEKKGHKTSHIQIIPSEIPYKNYF